MKLISDVTKAWKVVEDSQKSPDQAEWIDPVIAGAVEQLEADKQSIRDKREEIANLVIIPIEYRDEIKRGDEKNMSYRLSDQIIELLEKK